MIEPCQDFLAGFFCVMPNKNIFFEVLFMEIKIIDYDFSICKVIDYSLVNIEDEFCFVGKTDG